MDRRHFLGFGTLLVAACTRRAAGRDAAVPQRVRAPTPQIADEHDAPSCDDATAANIEGPFYKPGAPHRAVLADATEPGERFVVSGIIRSTDCKPIPGAEMEIWQANARGGYDLEGFHLRGALASDARGRWELRTIVPGRYLNGDRYRPAHLHIKLRAPGHRSLTTQLYFAGDPYNAGDPFIVSSLIMQPSDGRAKFDFTLATI